MSTLKTLSVSRVVVLSVVSCLLALGCKAPASPPMASQDMAPSALVPPAPAAKTVARVITLPPAKDVSALFKDGVVEELNPSGPPWPAEAVGVVDFGVQWRDRAGEHLVVASKHVERADAKNAGVLMLKRWIKGTSQEEMGDVSWRLSQEYKAPIDPCPFELTLGTLRGPWTLSDLNDDGVAELTFAWRYGCRADASPNTHEVILLNNTSLYALRGTSKVIGVGGEVGGEGVPAANFADDPRFLAHAELVWAKTVSDNLQ